MHYNAFESRKNIALLEERKLRSNKGGGKIVSFFQASIHSYTIDCAFEARMRERKTICMSIEHERAAKNAF
jgi:hypothetical protein